MTNRDEIDLYLDLDELSAGSFGLTPNTGGAMAEAASVCLGSQNHGLEGDFHQVGVFDGSKVAFLRYEITEEMLHSHRDESEATRDGAEGIALLLLMKSEVAKKFSRARKAGTGGNAGGFDYWFTKAVTPGFVFDDPAAGRLEVSGIRQGSRTQVNTRIKQKLKQTKKSDEHLADRSTFAIVVEFGRPQIWVKTR